MTVKMGDHMTPDVAKFLLDLQLSRDDCRLLDVLAEKARSGTLTRAEEVDLAEIRKVGRQVELMKVKARVAMKA
jgi:hypothetical protein